MRPQPSFATRIQEHDGVAVMALSGELDMATAPILRRNLAQIEDGGAPAITLDLREVTFIDSSGLKELVEASLRAQSNGHRLLMSGPSPAAKRLFELTGMQFLLEEQGASGGPDPAAGDHARGEKVQ
jgi:anti-sigma B factor antagonist